MRVVYVSPYPPQRDGIGDYTAALAEATRGHGHDVAVVVPGSAHGATPEVVGSLEKVDALMERLRLIDPDVVHVQFAVAAFGTRIPALLRLLWALRPLRARVVLTAHEVTRDTAILRAPGRALYAALGRLADVVLVHTSAAQRELAGVAGARPGRIAVVPHHRRPPPPATTDEAVLRARHGVGDAPLLLAFGFIHPDKGLEDLVDALGMLERGSAHLVVAGDVRGRSGAFRAFELIDRRHLARVRRRITALGLDDFVHITGYVPAGEIAPWFDAADAAVLPYRRIEQSSVGSLAATLGVPVIASTAGSLARDFGDPRWSSPPRDPAALAWAIGSFLGAARPERRSAAPREAAGADIDAVAAATLDAYARVPATPTPGRTPAERP